MITESGDLVIVAVQRGGESLGPGEIVLAAGDAVLVRGSWEALATHLPDDDDVLVVDEPDQVRRQVVPLGLGAKEAVGVLAGMVVLLATGAVPPAVAALLAAGALILLHVVSIDQAFRSISWTTVVLVGGMIPLSLAMQQTGAAEKLATRAHRPGRGLQLVRTAGGPVRAHRRARSAHQQHRDRAHRDPHRGVVRDRARCVAAPVLMAVNVAAAAALLTPVATPANLMVMEPGGYRFGDYWKLGLPLLGWFFVVSVVLVPVIWSF